jgi:hypothetical protein
MAHPPPHTHEENLCSQPVFGFHAEYRACALRDGAPLPATTDVWCYHHCGPFTGPPVAGDGLLFCSWSCYKGHLQEQPSYHNQMLLKDLATRARKEAGIIDFIKPAPERATLAVFGGTLAVDEFLAVARDPARTVAIKRGRAITEHMLVEHRRRQSDTESYKDVFRASNKDAPAERHESAGCSSATPSLFYDNLKSIRAKGKGAPTKTSGMFAGMMTKHKQNVPVGPPAQQPPP